MKLKKIAAAVLAAAVLATTPAAGALLSPFSVTANAADTLTEGDYSYTVNEDGETVTITEYSGTDTEVVIPGTLGGKNVTSIGDNAFYGCELLTSITIPNGVITIGALAFEDCKSLTSVIIPDSVTTIGDRAFSGCKSLPSVTIPDGVTIISYATFGNCESLTSVTISDNVTTIGKEAFWGCASLPNVSIPNSVTTIGEGAFVGCDSLEGITVEQNNANYTSIDEVLFNSDKSKLVCYPAGKKDKSYTIPDGVTTIDAWAFCSCESLESVTISNSVTIVGDYGFYGCKSLASVIISNSVTTIGIHTFDECTSLTSITIPDSVTTIGFMSFANCGLTSVTIPDSVTTLGDTAFSSCYSLTNVTLSNSVTKIGESTFADCRMLSSITIPRNVTIIDEGAFRYCYILQTVNYGGTKAEWEAIEIGEDNDYLTKAKIICTDGIIRKEFQSGEDFFDNDVWYRVSVDGTLEVIGCAGSQYTIEEVMISEEVDGKMVTTISNAAFNTYMALKSITIPNSVTAIDDMVFCGCKSLETVNFNGTIAEWEAIEIGEGNECLTNAEIICTDGIINEREPDTSEPTSSDTSEPTSSDTHEPTTSDTHEPTTSDTHEPTTSDTSEPTTSDTSEPENLQPGDYFVDGDLEYTVLKDGTLEIRGFAGDETKEIVIPETVKGKKVTSIGDAAFMDCTSLTSVTIPDSVTKIGGYAFSGCTSLETVNYGGRKSDWEAIEIDIENEPLTNAEIKFAEQTVEIVDEDTGVKTEVSTEDENLDGAEFEANPADHPTLWDLIKKIIEKAVDTIESVTEEAQKSLEEAAEAVKNGKGFAYDMGFKKNGKEVQPDKSVTVTVPVPDKFKNDIDKLNVYHLTNRGAVYVPSWIKDSSIMFKTNSFSPYVITTDKLEYAVADENTTVTPGDTDKNSGTSNGNDQAGTGIAIAIAPVVLACTAVAVASKKKK